MKFEESPYHTGQFLTIPSTGSGIALRHVEDKPFDCAQGKEKAPGLKAQVQRLLLKGVWGADGLPLAVLGRAVPPREVALAVVALLTGGIKLVVDGSNLAPVVDTHLEARKPSELDFHFNQVVHTRLDGDLGVGPTMEYAGWGSGEVNDEIRYIA